LISHGGIESFKDPRDARATLLKIDDLEEIFRFPAEGLESAEVGAANTGGDDRVVVSDGKITAELRARVDTLRERAAYTYGTSSDSVEIIRGEREKWSGRLFESVDSGQEDLEPGGRPN
jgi:hypothetical protein